MAKKRRRDRRFTGNARRPSDRAVLVYRADEPCLTYRCPVCGADTITAVVGPGTPPDTVRCMTTPGCTGHAVTDLDGPRKVPDVAAAWEWYKPNTEMIATVRKQGGPLWEHVQAGGMLLRHRRTFGEIIHGLEQASAALAENRRADE